MANPKQTKPGKVLFQEEVDEVRGVLKIALENMYMLGGNPKPEPKYDSYLNNMIEMVMTKVKKLKPKDDANK
jgi:hypothetical protein